MKNKLLLAVSCLALLIGVAAYGQIFSGHRSESDAVKKALEQADLKDVSVSDDASKNTITLGGTLHSEDAKKRAAEVAKSAAPNRQIANEISVEPVGAESRSRAMESTWTTALRITTKPHCFPKAWTSSRSTTRQRTVSSF